MEGLHSPSCTCYLKVMNRVILIGNGFDLAHGLPTRYEDFLNWYWEQRVEGLRTTYGPRSPDSLCTISTKGGMQWNTFAFTVMPQFPYKIPAIDIIKNIRNDRNNFDIRFSAFFERILNCYETKGWVDIENEYYNLLVNYAIKAPASDQLKLLNTQLHFIRKKLAEYLNYVTSKEVEPIERLREKIYAPIDPREISVERAGWFNAYLQECENKKKDDWRTKYESYGLSFIYRDDYSYLYRLPDTILFVNFNYTSIANAYLKDYVSCLNHIHGDLTNPKNMIFGYGDEMDKNYSQLQELNDNECLQNIKSVKYLETDNYRQVLSFIDSAPYQIYIMGHSCGNSDRTLLNTLFEHKNCFSIKPFYYVKDDGTDNYLDIVQNISRNFKDMKLMRDRVVNKTYCETIT